MDDYASTRSTAFDGEDFDPLAPIAFDEPGDGEEKDYYEEQVPPIAASSEEAAARRAAHPTPQLTRPQAIAKAFKGMPGQKKLLIHVVDYCREERTDEEIVAEILKFEHGAVNTYAPETIVSILARCGALEQTNGGAEEDGADGDEDVAVSAVPTPVAVEDRAGESGVDGDLPDVEADDGECLQVEVPEPARYIATEDGLAVVAQEDPARRFEEFMEANAVYAPIFRTILENCDREGGCSKKEVDALVDHDPLCREPRRFSGYFIDKLEEAEAIAFEGSWRTTEAGRLMLGEDGVIGSL